MKKEDIEELIDSILNIPDVEGLREWKTTPTPSKVVKEVNIIDLKGKRFKFPGHFLMTEENGSITFQAKKSQ
jgi:hypothetical protein